MPLHLRMTIALAVGCLASAAFSQENASNPLAAVNNTDLRFQATTADPGDTYDLFVDGSYMLMPNLKLNYELHYLSTDVTGSREEDLEKLVVKPIFFPTEGMLQDGWGYRVAVGFEAAIDLGDQSKGIGTGSDTIAPLLGVAFSNPEIGWTLVPLVQHFMDVNGDTDISQTAPRLIAIHPFADANWVRFDLKLPYDWENEKWPITAEVQLGRNINDGMALYADVLVGLGNDRPYDYGVGVGMRFSY